jgi:hypothetical protein
MAKGKDRVVNPADQARKEAKKKELAKVNARGKRTGRPQRQLLLTLMRLRWGRIEQA